jgi:hypothetical protein
MGDTIDAALRVEDVPVSQHTGSALLATAFLQADHRAKPGTREQSIATTVAGGGK